MVYCLVKNDRYEVTVLRRSTRNVICKKGNKAIFRNLSYCLNNNLPIVLLQRIQEQKSLRAQMHETIETVVKSPSLSNEFGKDENHNSEMGYCPSDSNNKLKNEPVCLSTPVLGSHQKLGFHFEHTLDGFEDISLVGNSSEGRTENGSSQNILGEISLNCIVLSTEGPIESVSQNKLQAPSDTNQIIGLTSNVEETKNDSSPLRCSPSFLKDIFSSNSSMDLEQGAYMDNILPIIETGKPTNALDRQVEDPIIACPENIALSFPTPDKENEDPVRKRNLAASPILQEADEVIERLERIISETSTDSVFDKMEMNLSEDNAISKKTSAADLPLDNCDYVQSTVNDVGDEMPERTFRDPDYLPDSGELSEQGENSSYDCPIPEETVEAPTKLSKVKILSNISITTPLLLKAVGVKNSSTVPFKEEKKRSKTYACLFCQKKVAKIVRHFVQKHSNEADVERFMNFPSGHEERRQIIDRLREEGCFKYNTDPNTNEMDLLLSRKPRTRQVSRTSFLPCPQCKKYMSRRNLSRHVHNVHLSTDNGLAVTLRSKRISADHHPEACSVLVEKVFPILITDDISRVIKHDRLIVVYGNTLCLKYQEHNHDLIRSKLRLLGRFFIEIRKKIDTVKQFFDILSARYINEVNEIIYKIAEYKDGFFMKPSLASSLMGLIRAISETCLAEFIRQNNSKGRENVKAFQVLFKNSLVGSIQKTVDKSQTRAKRAKKPKLPTNEEIRQLYKYITKRQAECFVILKNETFNYNRWLNLLEYTYVKILIYNKKRPGELQRTTLDDYKDLVKVDRTSEDFKCMSVEEQNLAANYARFLIVGKRYRPVPVLIDNYTEMCIELLLDLRNAAQIPENNEYLFAIKSTSTKPKNVLFGNRVCSRLFNEAGFTNSSRITPTALRKHLATATHSLNINSMEQDHLAKFMGHHINVHKNVYRQPDIVQDIKILPKLLNNAVEHPQSSTADQNNPSTCADGKDETDMEEESEEESECGSKVQSLSPTSSEGVDEQYYDYDNADCYYTPELSTITEASTSNTLNEVNTSGESGIMKNTSENENTTKEANKNRKVRRNRKKIRHRLNETNVPHAKVRWSTPVRRKALKLFHAYIVKKKKCPSLSTCAMAIKENSELQGRTPAQVKAWVANQIKSASKACKEMKRKAWSSEEKRILRETFKSFIESDSKQYPSKESMEDVLSKNPVPFVGRNVLMLKSQLQTLRNVYKRQKN